MSITGVITGLLTALFASLSYIFARYFTQHKNRNSIQLAVSAHILMGGISIIILPFIFVKPENGWGTIILPLAGSAGFFLIAQTTLLYTLSGTESNVISPLLGLKIIISALLGIIFNEKLLWFHWISISLTVFSILLLRGKRKRVTVKIILLVAALVICYSGSDYSIKYLIKAFSSAGGFKASMSALVSTYIACFAAALIALPRFRHQSAKAWRISGMYSLCWYFSMIFLFYTISNLGVIRSIILQSTRGIISVLLAYIFSKNLLFIHDEKVSHGERIMQICAAVLIIVSVTLFLKK
jgi:drug/metabolite transporter (DMT)-like permease